MSGAVQNGYGEQAVQALPTSGGIFAFSTPQYATYASSPIFAYTPSTGVAGTDPNALAALQNSFVAQSSNGLAAITSLGAAEYANVAGAFSTWASNLFSLGQQAGNIDQTIANKSAKACSGFFGCLF
jgi:hypothetical protein